MRASKQYVICLPNGEYVHTVSLKERTYTTTKNANEAYSPDDLELGHNIAKELNISGYFISLI